MGFFSSRRASPSSDQVNDGVAPSSSNPSDKSVAQLIRSRLNGRGRRHGPHTSPQNSDLDSTRQPVDDVSSHSRDRIHLKYRNVKQDEKPTYPTRPRIATDGVTMTLAQSLNELAAANADGLLNDDDYRVLRQNLFKSFASASAPPLELPIVKSVEPGTLHNPSTSRTDRATLNSMRSPSLRSQSSIGSSMSKLFHRARRRTSEKHRLDEQDTMSVTSSSCQSPPSLSTVSFPHALSPQASESSMRTAYSRQIPPDLRFMTSKRPVRGTDVDSDAGGNISRGSTRSLRGGEAPPSSFNAKRLAPTMSPWGGDMDRLRSASDIRAEIRLIEAEEQRVTAAFSFLGQQHRETTNSVGFSSSSRVYNDHTLSLSGIRTAISPSFNDDILSVGNGSSVPASFDAMAIGGHLASERMNNPLEIDAGMPDDTIVHRREEAIVRYRQRLDYLKARLKGAEIHERLMRK